MKQDVLYQQFVQKWQEVTELPTQTIGPLTPFYKRAVPFLKDAPWKIIIPLSFVAAGLLAIRLELTAAQIVSILQQGF